MDSSPRLKESDFSTKMGYTSSSWVSRICRHACLVSLFASYIEWQSQLQGDTWEKADWLLQWEFAVLSLWEWINAFTLFQLLFIYSQTCKLSGSSCCYRFHLSLAEWYSSAKNFSIKNCRPINFLGELFLRKWFCDQTF